MSSVRTELFGGAMSVCLPKNVKDVSLMREVPDNQEVFVHPGTPESLIIEILEHVPGSDQEAVRTHYEDLASDNEVICEQGDGSSIDTIEEINRDSIEMTQCASIWRLHGIQVAPKYKESPAAKNKVHIHMGLFRLPSYKTDIVVTWNKPLNISTLSSDYTDTPSVPNEQWSAEDFTIVVNTLQIHNSGLFS